MILGDTKKIKIKNRKLIIKKLLFLEVTSCFDYLEIFHGGKGTGTSQF